MATNHTFTYNGKTVTFTDTDLLEYSKGKELNRSTLIERCLVTVLCVSGAEAFSEDETRELLAIDVKDAEPLFSFSPTVMIKGFFS
jgi:hypothetical protein